MTHEAIHLQELQKLSKCKDDLIAQISHNIKTPLNSITGSLGPLIDQLKEDFERAQEEIDSSESNRKQQSSSRKTSKRVTEPNDDEESLIQASTLEKETLQQ